MACERVPFGPGMTAIVCRRGGRARPCIHCGKESSRLCDYPLARKGKTCSAPLCARCAIKSGGGADFCREHGQEWARRLR